MLFTTTLAHAWDADLEAAAKRVAAGGTNVDDLKLVRQNNDVVNQMANKGVIDNTTYQKVQKDFADFNEIKAQAAADKAGLEYGKQAPDPTKKSPTYDPGTDSDYIFKGKDGKPVTVEQIKKARTAYNADMNREFGTKNVDYAKKLDTDVMANAKGMSQKDFDRVSKVNNDAYRRKAAANYEAQMRAQKQYDIDVKKNPDLAKTKKRPRDPTLQESSAYREEMDEFRNKKKGEAAEYRDKAVDAKKTDPSGKGAKAQGADADMTTKMQQQGKYNKRTQGETRRIADKYGVDTPNQSKLPSEAANRSMENRPMKEVTTKNGRTKLEPLSGAELDAYNNAKASGKAPDKIGQSKVRELSGKELSDYNLKKAATANALDDQLTSQTMRNDAEVRAGASKNAPKGEADFLIKDAAKAGSKLNASQQGQLVDDVRTKYGDPKARQLADELKTANSAKAKPKIDADTAAGKALKGARQAADVGGKVMVGIDIGNAAQDILDVGSGKKSAGEAVETAIDTATGGALSTGKIVVQKGGDLAGALSAKAQQQASLDQDRVLQTGLNLSKAGVSKEERDRIMRAMESGDDSLLQSKVNELSANGKDVAVPDRKMADDIGYGDDGVADRAKEVGKGIADSAKRAGTFVVNTGKNLGEIGSGLTEEGVLDEVVDQARQNLTVDNVSQAPGAIVDIVSANRNIYLREQEQKGQKKGLGDRLRDMGATQEEVDQAMQDWDKNNTKTARNLRIRLQAEKKAAELAAAAKKAAESSENELRGAEVAMPDVDPEGSQGKDKKAKPESNIFSDFSDTRDSETAQDRKTGQSVNKAQTEVANASNSSENKLTGIQGQLDSAYNEGTKIRDAAANAANKQDMENGLGAQLTSGAEQAIKTGLQSAGTAIGTAVGQRIAKDVSRKGRDRSPSSDGKSDAASSAEGDSTSKTASTPSKKRKPKPKAKPKPRPSPKPTYVAKPKPKPKPAGGSCPICGRPGCPYR